MKKPVKEGVSITKKLEVQSLVDRLYPLGTLQAEKIVAIDIEGKLVAQTGIGKASGLLDEIGIITRLKLESIAFKRQAVNGENYRQKIKGED